MFAVNYVAVLLAAVSAMVVGFVWYSKAVFGKPWMKASGVTDAQMKAANKNMLAMYVPMYVGAVVTAYVLSMLVDLTNATTVSAAMQVAFWIWLGFIATSFLGSVLFERRSWTYYGITAGYYLVNLLVMSAVLVLVG